MAISSGARGTASQQQDRRNMDAARAAGNSAPGVGGGGGFGGGGSRGTLSQQQDRINTEKQRQALGPSSGSQRQAARLSEINRVGRLANQSTTPTGNTGVSPAGRTASTLAGMGRDYRNVGAGTIDKIGNFLASNFGFNEQRPSIADAKARATGTAPGVNIDKRAGWGFDPAGAIGSVAGAALGVPLMGTVFDKISELTGRPLEMSMGPDVFGLDGSATTGSAPADPSNMAARNASYMSGRSVRPRELSIQTASGTPNSASGGGSSGTTGGMVGGNAADGDASSADRDFGANSSAVAASRSPFNQSIGGFSGGGYVMDRTRGGGSGRTSGRGHTTGGRKSLAEGLMRYRNPYDIALAQ